MTHVNSTPGTLPTRDASKPSEQQGLFRKYDVCRVDGCNQPGGKHHDCEYFVLDTTHDQHARAALRAYADACAPTHPELSADLIARYGLAPVAQPAAAPVRLKEQLRRAMDLLDTYLGDSDAMLEGMTQQEIAEEFPAVAAMQIVAGLYQEAPEDETVTDTPRAYPDELTDTLRHVLGFPNFRCAPYAHLMRDAGGDIESRAEDEQAHVLHWLVKLVLDHGERWADVAEEELNAMRDKAKATCAGEGQ